MLKQYFGYPGLIKYIVKMTFTCFCSFNVATSTFKMTFTEEQISCDITYMWNLKKNGTSELIYKNRNRVTHVKNSLMMTNGERGGWINWKTGTGTGTDRYTLLYIK